MTNLLNQSDLRLLWKETKERWKANTPKYFRTMQLFWGALIFIGGTPQLVAKIAALFTPQWADIVSYILIGIGTGGILNGKTVVKASDIQSTDLPYTDKKQIQQEIKQDKQDKQDKANAQ